VTGAGALAAVVAAATGLGASPPACDPGAVNCATASGTITYIERVDPDGDGDAHFVLLSSDSVTAPDISVIDVRRDLRPRPLPQPGDLAAAAGPVYPGTYGQHQIQATAVAIARTRLGGG
jgi:hypothetical protein